MVPRSCGRVLHTPTWSDDKAEPEFRFEKYASSTDEMCSAQYLAECVRRIIQLSLDDECSWRIVHSSSSWDRVNPILERGSSWTQTLMSSSCRWSTEGCVETWWESPVDGEEEWTGPMMRQPKMESWAIGVWGSPWMMLDLMMMT